MTAGVVISKLDTHSHGIKSYGNGSFILNNGTKYSGAILITNNAVYGIDSLKSISDFSEELFMLVKQTVSTCDVFFIGCGENYIARPKDLDILVKNSLLPYCDYMDTGAAARSLGLVLQENRSVAALLLPV